MPPRAADGMRVTCLIRELGFHTPECVYRRWSGRQKKRQGGARASICSSASNPATPPGVFVREASLLHEATVP